MVGNVYIVEVTAGDYEDVSNTIIGVFSDPAVAEACKSSYEQLMQEYKDSPCPVDMLRSSKWTEDDDKKFAEWDKLQDLAKDFRFCKVLPFIINKCNLNKDD